MVENYVRGVPGGVLNAELALIIARFLVFSRQLPFPFPSNLRDHVTR